MRILFVHEVNYRMKVIFEMHDFPELLSLAGHDVVFVDFAEGVERSGWRRFFDWSTETSIVRERAHSGAAVEVRTPGRLLPPPFDRLVASITQVPAIVRTIRDHQPDVLVLYAVPTNGWQAIMIARRMGVPVLFRALDISHELRPTVFDRLVERAERFVYRNASTVSANNAALADYVASKGASERNVRVDYPGIDLERFSPGGRSEALMARHGLEPGDQVVQFMGTLYRFAGLDWLIEELAPMLRAEPHRKVMLVGGGEAELELRAQVERLELQSSVLFTGWIGYDELADHLRLADVAVTPFAEKLVANCALPSKILQYAGCGVPTVCTRLDGMSRMIADGDGVMYRAPGEPFVSAITSWLDDDAGRRSAGAKARSEIERLCRWDTAVTGFEDALGQAIERMRMVVTRRSPS